MQTMSDTLLTNQKVIPRKHTTRVRGRSVMVDALNVGDQTFLISGKLARTAHFNEKDEWLEDVTDPESTISALQSSSKRIDLLRFAQRIPDSDAKFPYYKEWRQVAAIPVTNYKHWLTRQITRNARNKVRKTEKFGVAMQESSLNDDLVRGIMGIFNQSPVRRGKRFWHYGKDFETVKAEMSLDLNESIFITARYQEELIGFIKLFLTDRYAMITLILDKLTHRDKAPMNGMIAKAVEICAERRIPYIVYTVWRRGEHGQFQESVGFQRIPVPEYFVPLTVIGRIALRLRLHKGVKGLIPEKLMMSLLAWRARWYSIRYRVT